MSQGEQPIASLRVETYGRVAVNDQALTLNDIANLVALTALHDPDTFASPEMKAIIYKAQSISGLSARNTISRSENLGETR